MRIKLTIIGLSLAAIIGAPAAHGERLSFERLRADPPLSGTIPRGIAITPDGARVTFLQPRAENRDHLDLWQIDVASGSATRLLSSEDLIEGAVELTAEEEARRQRLRIREGGITNYRYDETGNRLLIPLAGNLYIYEIASGAITPIVSDDPRLDPKLSPSGDRVAFVRDRNLWLRNLATGEEAALTETGSETIANGLAEFIAQEEMGRYDAFWWSPDGERIAFIEYDESNVHLLERVAIGGDGATLIEQRYPLAGTANVAVRVGIVELASGATRWVDLGDDLDIYIPRVQWSQDSTRLYVQRQPRSQRQLDLLAVNPANGRASVLLTETARSWINLHDDLVPLSDGRFLWSSDRTGFRHIYLYDESGEATVRLTEGTWLVDEIECVDETAGLVMFTGWRDDPLTSHLYRASLDGRDSERPERLTQRDGVHSITAADDCSAYVDQFSAPNQPPQVSLHDADGQRVAWIYENRLDSAHAYGPYLDTHVIPDFGTLDAEDGTQLHYSLYRPADFDASARYPAIVQVYGGPRAQRVTKSWGPLDAQVYADAGFVVFRLDNRGSYRRGVAFESGLQGLLGDIEVRDQLAGIRFLTELGFVDPDRIGVQGWSYGGYMTLMLLAKGGDRIAAGVAGAPVTDWRLYDTHYTERYLGLPDANANGYERSSVFPYLDGIEGALLLIHGMADDNVFFTNSTKLMQSLQQANVPFDLMTYPGETHFIRNRASALHADLTSLRFFERHLN